jgi:cytochrome c oxidase subunit 1
MLYSDYYIYKYWVGLLDGAGEIQINHSRYRWLEYRIVIKLEANPENEELFLRIKKELKGFVDRDSKYIYWSEIKTSRIQKVLIPLIKRYPLLNTRIHLQFLFMLHCMSHRNVAIYLQDRPYKYKIPYVYRSEEEIYKVFYFATWLSGYIEAVGSFIFREKSSKAISFAIKEKDDYFLIAAIKLYFGFPNKIRQSKSGFFEIEVSHKFYLTRIINQGVEFPFLGYKKVMFKKFEESVVSSYHCVF